MVPGAHAYVVGGAGDEITLRDNVAAWARIAIRPRVLVGVGERDPRIDLLGVRRPHPLIIAPMAYQRMADPDGEIAMARAAASSGAVMCLSTLGTTSAPQPAEAGPGAPRRFPLDRVARRGAGP